MRGQVLYAASLLLEQLGVRKLHELILFGGSWVSATTSSAFSEGIDSIVYRRLHHFCSFGVAAVPASMIQPKVTTGTCNGLSRSNWVQQLRVASHPEGTECTDPQDI